MEDVAKMVTLHRELPYQAALSNLFSSQWQLNCHMKSHIVHPMLWMMAILLHISSTFGIDNIKSISEDVQLFRIVGGDPEIFDVGELQDEEEAVDPELSFVLAYQDSVWLKEQITCRQL